jgi:hypothetical protein
MPFKPCYNMRKRGREREKDQATIARIQAHKDRIRQKAIDSDKRVLDVASKIDAAGNRDNILQWRYLFIMQLLTFYLIISY